MLNQDLSQSPQDVNSERFIAFVFSGADMVIETDSEGIVTHAAGAFRSKVGQAADWFVGHSLRELVAPVDHETLLAELSLLVESGRLQPLIVRLSDPGRTHLSLAGIPLPVQGRPLIPPALNIDLCPGSCCD